jgi:hypothetical protein
LKVFAEGESPLYDEQLSTVADGQSDVLEVSLVAHGHAVGGQASCL